MGKGKVRWGGGGGGGLRGGRAGRGGSGRGGGGRGIEAVPDETPVTAVLGKSPQKMYEGAFETETGEIQAKRLIELRNGGESLNKTRQVAKKCLPENADVLRKLMGEGEGRDLLDGMVEDMGAKAKSQASKDFVKAAIEARYNVDELTGELSTSMLPNLYRSMKMVPDAHTLLNDSLKRMDRNRTDGSSTYSDAKKQIDFKVAKTTKDDQTLEGADDMKSKVSYFTHTVLHEVGHAVDDKLGFMKGRQTQDEYGGWQSLGVNDVVNALLQHYRLDPAYDVANEEAARFVIDSILTGTDREAALAAAQEDLEKRWANNKKDLDRTKPLAVDYDAIADHEAIGMYAEFLSKNPDATSKVRNDKHVELKALAPGILSAGLMRIFNRMDSGLDGKTAVDRAREADFGSTETDWTLPGLGGTLDKLDLLKVKGESEGLWDESEGKIGEAALGDSVVQEAYKNQFWQYKAAARNKRVSSYQFRAPGEWFAEIYALYYQGKLPQSHPGHAWMSTEVDNPVNQPDDV